MNEHVRMWPIDVFNESMGDYWVEGILRDTEVVPVNKATR